MFAFPTFVVAPVALHLIQLKRRTQEVLYGIAQFTYPTEGPLSGTYGDVGAYYL